MLHDYRVSRLARARGVFWVLALVIVGAFSTQVLAGAMSVWPLRVNLSPGDEIEQVHVTNDADEPAYMQATVSSWWTAETGETSDEVKEVIAVPPVFELGPGETQIVKLAYRDPSNTSVERAFRLEIMEVPKTVGLLPNTAVIATRMVLPVFFSPADTAPQPTWKLRREPLKDPVLILENKGTAHIDVKSIKVVSQEDKTLVLSNEESDIVLPSKEKVWTLDASLARVDGAFTIEAETNIGLIESSVSFSGS